jgi:CAAX amino terminal protease family.
VIGLMAGYFRDETGSLGAPIIIHSLVNIISTLFALL